MNSFEFGKYLKELREVEKISIRKLSLLSGISLSYISQLENGKRGIPKPNVLKKLSPCLNVSYEDLMAAAGYISPAVTADDSDIHNFTDAHIDIEQKLQETIEFIEHQEGLTLNGEPLDELRRALLAESIEFALNYAKKNLKRTIGK